MRSISKDLLRDGKTTPSHRWVSWWMLYKKRQYVIEKIKKPLMKAITVLANRYPEPTKEHTFLPRTHLLIDIQDAFFEREKGGRNALFRALFKMFIVEYEHDPYYRFRIDWLIGEMVKRGWGNDPITHTTQCWKEPASAGEECADGNPLPSAISE